MTATPAGLIGSPAGRLAPGAPADLILLDDDQPWVVDKSLLRSRSKNSPFDEARLTGRVMETYVAGKRVFALEN
jgi:dihydroorotase